MTADVSERQIKKYNEMFSRIGCAQIYDAARQYCHVLNINLTARSKSSRLSGPVFPVNTNDDMLPGIQALSRIPSGWIIYIRNLSEQIGALAGDVFLTACEKKDVGGVVVDGYVRDIELIYRDFSIPVYSSGVCIRSADTAVNPVQEVPESIQYADFSIEPGDFIFADPDGQLIVKQRFVSVALMSAMRLRRIEEKAVVKLQEGCPIGELTGLDDFLAGRGEMKFKF